MEFSWNYIDAMRRLSDSSHYVQDYTNEDAKIDQAYSCMLNFDFGGEECEVPIFAKAMISDAVNSEEAATNPVSVVIPLFSSRNGISYSGAEAIIRNVVRASYGRITKATTSKGEVYYGAGGIILDKDLEPLLLSTMHLKYDHEEHRYRCNSTIIHLHPKVFTDEKSTINKSLAKKGLLYYLTHTPSNRGFESEVSYKVVIDDSSQFLRKPVKPDLSDVDNTVFTKLLKENIGEVLQQVAYDYR